MKESRTAGRRGFLGFLGFPGGLADLAGLLWLLFLVLGYPGSLWAQDWDAEPLAEPYFEVSEEMAGPPALTVEQQLLIALRNGDILKVREILGPEADWNLDLESGGRPLNWALEEGHYLLARYLLDRGADPDSLDRVGRPGLLVSAIQSRRDLLDLLVAQGADPQGRDSQGRTVLHGAAYRNLSPALNYFLAQGLDPDLRSISGYTPLMAAAESGSLEALEQLRLAGADILSLDFFGRSALDYARRRQQSSALELLEGWLEE